MNTEPRIETLTEKILVGKHIRMSLSNDKTVELWQSFMPRRKEIQHTLTTDLFCMQVYDPSLHFKNFNPTTVFDKWAAVEVSSPNNIPNDMDIHVLKGGLYAVFNYIGTPSTFHQTFQFIFNDWIPNSAYEVDNREHFELLGDKYKNNQPDSEEEIWVPIKIKK